MGPLLETALCKYVLFIRFGEIHGELKVCMYCADRVATRAMSRITEWHL